MRTKRIRILASLVSLALLLPSTAPLGVSAASTLDFGDAPDGKKTNYAAGTTGAFPSLLKSNGARTATTSEVWLGEKVNREADSKQVDRDEFDDGASVELTSCTTSTLTVLVHIAKTRTSGTAYLNAFFDWNQNGKWAGEDACAPEWAVRNVPIDLSSQTTTVKAYTVKFTAGKNVDDLWHRVMVTKDERVTSEDGIGSYTSGEVEDYGPTALSKKKPKDPKGKKFGATCKPDPLVIPHGGSGKFEIKKKPGSVGITSVGLAISVTPNTPARSIKKTGATTFTYTSKKVDPPKRVVTETVPVRVRFGTVASIDVKCRVSVVHDSIQPVVPGTHDVPSRAVTGSVRRITNGVSPGFRVELQPIDTEIVSLQLSGIDIPLNPQHPNLRQPTSVQLNINGQGWPQDWRCEMRESNTVKRCIGQTPLQLNVESFFDIFFEVNFTDPHDLHLHLLDPNGNVLGAVDLPFQSTGVVLGEQTTRTIPQQTESPPTTNTNTSPPPEDTTHQQPTYPY